MADANIYTLFRTLAADATSPYTIPNIVVWSALDAAIDALSAILPKWAWQKDLEITAADVTAGYKNFTSEIVMIDNRYLKGENRWWRIDGSTKLYLIDPDIGVPTTITTRYKTKYAKFKGVTKTQAEMDIPISAEYPVVLYALASWLVTTGAQIDSDAAATIIGNIKSKSEENMSMSFGFTTDSILNNPEKIKEQSLELMHQLSGAQDDIFSVGSFQA